MEAEEEEEAEEREEANPFQLPSTLESLSDSFSDFQEVKSIERKKGKYK